MRKPCLMIVALMIAAVCPAMAAEETLADNRGMDQDVVARAAPAPTLYANVVDFGADPANADNTEAIQRALNSAPKAIVPPGVYAVNGTVVIQERQHLHLCAGAWLQRFADRTDNTKPVVRLISNWAALTGESLNCGVSTENPSGGFTGEQIVNNGVVNVGPLDAGEYTDPNINFWIIDSITISGSWEAVHDYVTPPHDDKVDRNELLTLVNSVTLPAKGGSCYLGRVSNCSFRDGGVAIKLNPVCNGNIFTNNLFYEITHSCFYAEGVTENVFSNCFVHSTGGVTVIRLRRSGYNHFYGVMCEPGATGPQGRYTRFCDISEDCWHNVLIGHGDTGHAYINNSNSSLIITHATLDHRGVAYFGEIKTGQIEIGQPEPQDPTAPISEVFIRNFQPTKPSEFHDVFTLVSDSPNQVFMMEISVTSGSPDSSNHSGASFIVSGKTSSGNEATATVDRIGGNPNLQCQTHIEGNTVTVQLKPSHYRHGRFVIMLRAKGSGNCEIRFI